jgi:thymidine kinase
MFSSKTEALHGQLRRQAHARRTVVLFRPTTDTRDRGDNTLSAHDGGSSFEPQRLPGKNYIEWVNSSAEVLKLTQQRQADAIGIDEGQFFDEALPDILSQLHREGVKLFYAGLDTDWRAQPFATTAKVMMCPEVNVHKMTAVCSLCGSETATRSLKKDAGLLDKNKVIDPGGQEKYDAACESCYFKVMNLTPTV